MMMSREEYIEECQGLIDSFDDHVDGDMVVFTLRALADRVEREGLTQLTEPSPTDHTDGRSER